MNTIDLHLRQAQVLQPDAQPDDLRRVLYGPLSAYWQGTLDVGVKRDHENGEIEIIGEVDTDADLYLKDLIRENYTELGNWSPAELHQAMLQAVPLPFEVTGEAEVPEIQRPGAPELGYTEPVGFVIDFVVDHVGAFGNTDESAVVHIRAVNAEIT